VKKERQKLHNLRIEHVTIQSELKYLVGAILLEVESAKTRRVTIRLRVATACDWMVRFLGGSEPEPNQTLNLEPVRGS
jgi:hypothetical protein